MNQSAITMSRHRPALVLALLGLLAAWSFPGWAQEHERTDSLGDPLPPRALFRLGTNRLRQGANVYALAYSPDGKTLVSAGRNNTIFIWEARSGKKLRQLSIRRHTSALAFSRDGKLLASAHGDSSIRVWQFDSGEELFRFDGDYSARQLLFSPDDKNILASDGRQLHVWSAANGKHIRRVDFGQGNVPTLGTICLSDDGKLAARITRSGDKEVVDVRDVDTGKTVHAFAFDKGRALVTADLSPDGKKLAVWDDWTYSIYEVATGKRQAQMSLKDGHHVFGLAFVDDDRLAARGDQGMIWLWDLKSGKLLRSLARHQDAVVTIAVSPDRKALASGSHDGNVRLTDLETGKQLEPQIGHVGRLGVHSAVAIDPAGKRVLSVASDPMAREWDLATGKQLHELGISSVEMTMTAAYSPDRRFMAAGNGKGTIQLWDAKSAQPLAKFALGGPVYCVLFTSDGKKLLACGFGKEIVVWDTATRKEIQRLPGHQMFTSTLALSPDGKVLASSGGFDRRIRLRDFATGKEIHDIEGTVQKGSQVRTVVFTASGKHLISAGHDGAVLWDVAAGKQVRVLTPDPTYGLAVAADSKVALGLDETILIVLAETPTELAELRGHHGRVGCLAFTPDGKTLVSGSEDATLLVWDVADLNKR